MSDRDQLAGIAQERILEYRFSSVTLEVAYAVADAIIAAGWRAPEREPEHVHDWSDISSQEQHDAGAIFEWCEGCGKNRARLASIRYVCGDC